MSGVFGLQLRLVDSVSDPDLRPQLCNLHFRLQQLLSHRLLPLQQLLFRSKELLPQRPLPLHPLQRKRLRLRLRLRIRPQLLQLQLRPRPLLPHIAPTALPAPPRSSCRRLLLLRVATARLQLDDGPHALVGHGGGGIEDGCCCCCCCCCRSAL